MGGLILLLDLSYIPPEGWRVCVCVCVWGGGGAGGSLGVPVFTWDFHKTQPYQVSIRSKTYHLLHKLLQQLLHVAALG